MDRLKSSDSDSQRNIAYLVAWYVAIIGGFVAAWQMKALIAHGSVGDALSDWVNYTVLISLITIPIAIVYLAAGLFVLGRSTATVSKAAFVWILLALAAASAIIGFFLT